MRKLLFLALAGVLSSAPDAVAQAPVAVAVVVQEAQFVDQAQQDRLDTAADLKKGVGAQKKTMRLVGTPSEAAVVIEVLGRSEEVSGNAQLRQGSAGQVEQTRYKDKVVRLKLSVGDYSTEIQGRHSDGEHVLYTSWKMATGHAVGQIENWIKANRAKLP